MKVSFNFATVASLMVVPPLSTLVPKLGFVQVVEGGTIEPRSIIQDRELSTWNIYRMKGSKKNTAVPTPAPVAAPSLAPVEPFPGQKGPTELCNKCANKTGGEYDECWYDGLFKLAGFTPDPSLDASRWFQQLTFQKPKPTELRAIGGDASSWGGVTPLNYNEIRFTSDNWWERTYGHSHANEAMPSKIVYKQGTDSTEDYNTYNIPYDKNFTNTNNDFLKIIVNLLNPENLSPNPLTMGQAMDRHSTDGIMVIKDGKIIAEHYQKPFDHRTRHRAYSMTKSFTGVTLATLIERQDEFGISIGYNDLITKHVPDLDQPGGAFKDTTIRQVMDMSNEFTFTEGSPSDKNCVTKVAEVFHCAEDPSQIKTGEKYVIEEGCETTYTYWYPELPNRVSREFHLASTRNLYARFPGPQTYNDGLLALKRKSTDKNGDRFTYRTANTNALGWMIENLLNNKGMEWFSNNIWSKLHQNSDMLWHLDERGYPNWGGGTTLTLKDSARFSEMMLNGGKNHKGEEVVPKAVIEDIVKGGTEDNLQQFKEGPYGVVMNCVFSSSTKTSCDQYWPGGILPENYPVRQYLKAIGEPNAKGIESGMAYRNQYWVFPDHIISQQGVHGQFSVFLPKVNMVIASFSSQVDAQFYAREKYLTFFAIAAHYANYEPK